MSRAVAPVPVPGTDSNGRGTGVEFGLLGPLRVGDGDSVVTLAAAKQRVILAALLVRAGTVVANEELVSLLWAGDPPPGALITLRNHVMRLRRSLGEDAAARIRTRPPGYLIELSGSDVLDLLAFEAAHERGRRAAREGRWKSAADELTAALALWRGEPLADVPSDRLQSEHRNRLEQLRLDALEARIEAEMHQGEHHRLVAELRTLVDREPLREGLRGLLMLALYRADRRSEALAEYREGRRVLAEELGVDTSAELACLHERILRADPGLDLDQQPAAGRAPVPGGPPPRHDLPRDLPDFTGRRQEVDRILRHWGSRATRVLAVDGMPGVGKTVLAVHAAHRLADRYPDGRLFLDLHGHTAGRAPLPLAEALPRLLTALGLAQDAIPEDTEEAAARWRAETDGRALLVVLDNAADAEQVRPLLPGGPRCAVLITSRRRLLDLEGVETLSLDVLPAADAAELFRRVAGERHAGAATAEVLEAAELCGRLPLALRVAAARLRSRPAWSVPELSRRLRGYTSRAGVDIDAADADPHGAAAAFALSYDQLDPRSAQLFRLLGLVPGSDVDTSGTAALTGETVGATESLLDVLLDSHLLQEHRAGRFRLHDLLRVHARRTAVREESAAARRAALDRLLHHYRHRSRQAADLITPDERDRRPVIPVPPGHRADEVGFDDTTGAIAWLDLERHNLVVGCGTDDLPQHSVQMSELLARYLERAGHHRDAVRVHGTALAAARALGDPVAEAKALRWLGVTQLRTRRLPEALSSLHEALGLVRQHHRPVEAAAVLMNIGVVHGMMDHQDESLAYFQEAGELSATLGDGNQEGRALANTGVIERKLGRYQDALGHLRRALVLHRGHGNRVGESMVRDNLGVLCRRLGLLDEALEHHREALAIDRSCNDRGAEVISLDNLGLVHHDRGESDRAMELFQAALDLGREIEETASEAIALGNIGSVHLRQGRAAEAVSRQREALAIARGLQAPLLLAQLVNQLGESLRCAGDPAEAILHHTEALGLTEHCRDPFETARTHAGLFRAHRAAGAEAEAIAHGRQGLAGYRTLQVPDAELLAAEIGC